MAFHFTGNAWSAKRASYSDTPRPRPKLLCHFPGRDVDGGIQADDRPVERKLHGPPSVRSVGRPFRGTGEGEDQGCCSSVRHAVDVVHGQTFGPQDHQKIPIARKGSPHGRRLLHGSAEIPMPRSDRHSSPAGPSLEQDRAVVQPAKAGPRVPLAEHVASVWGGGGETVGVNGIFGEAAINLRIAQGRCNRGRRPPARLFDLNKLRIIRV